MSKKRYVVRLTKREREDLSALIRCGKGKVGALKRRHARVLLKVDQGQHGPSWSEERNASIIGVDGPFTPKDARIQPKRLYPQFQT